MQVHMVFAGNNVRTICIQLPDVQTGHGQIEALLRLLAAVLACSLTYLMALPMLMESGLQ